MSKHFLLHTFGSLGDLHPLIALGLGLQAQGHRASIATCEPYRARVLQASLGFYPVRPHFDANDPALLAKIMDSKTGTQYVFKDLTLPYLRETYADLTQAAKQADVLISSSLTFAAPIVAEKTGIPWISCVYAPVSFFSAHDPSVVNVPLNEWLSQRGPWLNRWFFKMGKVLTKPWAKTVYDFRKELGLSKGESPFFEAQHSPRAALALFSKHFSAPQKDWPLNSHATGFLFYDGPEQTLDPDLEDFLQAGEAPVVFTLGSSAVYSAGSFYQDSLEAIQELAYRAVLLVGKGNHYQFPQNLPKTIFISDYAPYSKLFPRASAVVHQGGIGTTAQVLRAGKPMLVMPFAHDQFDNALRVKRLGVGLSLRKEIYRAKLKGALEHLLSDARIHDHAKELGQKIRQEQGLEQSYKVIERAVAND